MANVLACCDIALYAAEKDGALEGGELPPIFHYWSHTHLRVILEDFYGESSIARIFAHQFAEAIERAQSRRFASLGSGDGWIEVEIAKALREREVTDFKLELVELSAHLLDRAKERVQVAGLSDNFIFTEADISKWRAKAPYAAVMACQSFRHFQALERIFDAVYEGLAPAGVFVASDAIGRNGHMRWPEQRLVVQHFWSQLPARYKYHHQLQRLESPQFLDWDCSAVGFEGVRVQDILPLLTERFGFTHFASWSGVIDPFIDRGFGYNFSVNSEEDRAFIDRLHSANEDLLRIGLVKPTQMLAVMVKDKDAICRSARGLDPWSSVRDPRATEPVLG